MTTQQLAKRLVREFTKRNFTIATAESCTGGLIAKCITDIAGSSAVLLGGFVTYTNQAKIELLGVDPALIDRDTEVSASCAKAMACGARERLKTAFGVSTTGYAGPTGGSDADPVGTVFIGVSTPSTSFCERFCAPVGATRAQVRAAAAHRAMDLLLLAAEKDKNIL